MPVSERNRAIFRTMQADVVAFVEQEDDLLAEVLEHEGVLEGRQVETTRATIEYQREMSPTDPACEWDAPWIPNGDYSVTLYDVVGSDFLFRIHLVREGLLAGKRIVKYKAPGQRVYKGFGFVTKDGGFSLWRRFANQTDQPYVLAVRRLFESLAEITVDNRTSAEIVLNISRLERRVMWPTGMHRIGNSGAEGSWKITTLRCMHCNNPSIMPGSATRFALCIAHGTIPVALVREADPEFERLLDEEQRIEDEAARQRSVGSEWDGESDTSTAASRRRRRQAAPVAAQRGSGPMMDMIEGKYVL